MLFLNSHIGCKFFLWLVLGANSTYPYEKINFDTIDLPCHSVIVVSCYVHVIDVLCYILNFNFGLLG